MHRRGRHALLCVLGLAACWLVVAGAECSDRNPSKTYHTEWQGAVVVANPPASAAPGATIRLDLTGTAITGATHAAENLCIAAVTVAWDDVAGEQTFAVPESAGCRRLSGYAIDVVVPRQTLAADGTTAPWAGGELKLAAYTEYYSYVRSAAGGSIRVAATGAPIAATPANAAPTADLFARYRPMPAAGAEPTNPALSAAEAASTYAAVDARMSTDPEGGALAYAWDLDGDGAYGDAADGGSGATGLPDGVAIVPAVRRVAPMPTTTEVEVGVRVTDPAGLSATKRLAVTVTADYPVNRVVAGLDPASTSVGGTVTLGFDAAGTDLACIDPDGADPVSTSGSRLYLLGAPGRTFAITAGAAGRHRVTAAIWFGHDFATCAGADASLVRYTWSDVYTATAARTAAARYEARARFGIRATKAVAGRFTPLGVYDKVITRARYRLTTPARGGGAARPAALRLFRRGDAVMSAPALRVFGIGPRTPEVLVGTSTLLLRGAGGALACVRASGGVNVTRYELLGGTGPAAGLRFDATGPATKPLGSRGTAAVIASTGSSRALPRACRALIRHLP